MRCIVPDSTTYQLTAVLFSRRSLVAMVAGATLLAACDMPKKLNPMAKVAPLVKSKERWTADHLFQFLRALPPTAMLNLKRSQGLLKAESTEDELLGPDADARSIQEHLLWLSSSIVTYPFRDPYALSYHDDAVVFIAKKTGVQDATIDKATTFSLESELHKLLFAQLWDSLTVEQRRDLLQKLDPSGSITDKAAIAPMGGAVALAALSGTVAFAGFAFYTTMSVTIATVAGALGVTLPFAAYTGASTVVGVLSGPVGWAIAGVVALGSLVLAGSPNVRKTAALVAQIHALKVEALRAAGTPEEEIFTL